MSLGFRMLALRLGACSLSMISLSASESLQVSGGLWLSATEGYFRLDGFTQPLPGFSLQSVDLSIDDDAAVLRADARLAVDALPGADLPFDLSLGGFRYRSSGTEIATGRPLTYPQQADLFAPVDVAYELDDLYVGVNWRVLNRETWSVGIGLAVHYLEARVTPGSIAADLQVDESLVFPLAVASAHWRPVSWFEIRGQVQGIDVSYGDDAIAFIDADVGLWFRPVPYAGLGLGYRYTVADAAFRNINTTLASGDTLLNITLNGPWAALEFRW